MKKIVVLIGSILGLLVIIAGLIFQIFGWWEFTLISDISGEQITHTEYLSPFGRITNDYFDTVTTDGGIIIILIAILVIIGNISVLIGGLLDRKLISIIGVSIVFLSLLFFIFALGSESNFPRINTKWFLRLASNDYSVYWGNFINEGVIVPGDYSWRLGNGFLIMCVGCIVSIVGVALKDTKKIETQT